MSIPCLHFSYKTCVFVTNILIGCMHLKLSPCDHKDLANAAKGEEERRWIVTFGYQETNHWNFLYFTFVQLNSNLNYAVAP
jgi:hypothetical protein